MRTTWGGRARRGWSRMDSLWVVPRAKLGRFGNDEKASCVTVSRRRSVLLSPSAARSTTSPLPFVAMYRRTWGSALSILILLFHSASSVFRASSFPFFSRSLSSLPPVRPLFPPPPLRSCSSFSFSLSSRRPNRAIRAREFDLLVSPLCEIHLPSFPALRTDLPAPVTGTLHLPEHHHLRINRVWKINAARGDPRGGESASASAGGITVEREKGRAQWYPCGGPGVPCQRDTRVFFCRGYDSLFGIRGAELCSREIATRLDNE